jgi:glutamate dehydrogenase (NAD(P)+)
MIKEATPLASMDMLFGESPALQAVTHNFMQAAGELELEHNIAVRLARPDKVIMVSLPVQMDDGHIRVFSGFRVQHNHALGPYKGGIRYHPDVDLGEVTALATQMTWKNGLMNLPLGGGKGAVRVDPHQLSENELQQLTRRYTAEIGPFIGPEVDIPAPDMGTNDLTMAWIMDTYSQHVGRCTPHVVTGKPVDVGGSVLRKEATGRGVVYCIEEAANEVGLKLDGATAVLHGFGNVGIHAAAELTRRRVRLTAVADVTGGYVREQGLDVDRMIEHTARHGTLEGFSGAERIPAADVLTIPCDILIPASIGQVITQTNAARVKCRILAEGANTPTLPEADAILEKNGVFIIPDTICNAGGVIVSYFEWVQGGINFFWTAEEIDTRLSNLIRAGYQRARDFSRQRRISTRTAALCVGIARVASSMRLRGLYA